MRSLTRERKWQGVHATSSRAVTTRTLALFFSISFLTSLTLSSQLRPERERRRAAQCSIIPNDSVTIYPPSSPPPPTLPPPPPPQPSHQSTSEVESGEGYTEERVGRCPIPHPPDSLTLLPALAHCSPEPVGGRLLKGHNLQWLLVLLVSSWLYFDTKV